MKSFRTTFQFKECAKEVDHSSRVITIGSCFSEVIGERLLLGKFNGLINPFGTIFNPISIFRLLAYSLESRPLDENMYLNRHDNFFHYQLHSSFNGATKEELSQSIELVQLRTKERLQSATHLFITLGTAFVYQLLTNNEIVANCQKQSQKLFTKRMLSFGEMMEAYEIFHQKLKKINTDIQVVLTISPVRHTKDGIPENQLSKSMLRVFCDQIIGSYPETYYFPAYELMMDDLRDYRFYKDDMIHPNSMAEEYIWEEFQASFFNDETKELIHHINQINKNLNHRPFNPYSKAHYQFLSKLRELISLMPPGLDFSKEKNSIHDQMRQIEKYLE
jgi:hypothetical protein